MKLVYATRATIPYASACSWNIMQTCEALAEMGHDVALFAGWKPWRGFPSRSRTFEYYGIEPDFELRRTLDLPRNEWLYNGAAVQFARRKKATIYTRSTSLAAVAGLSRVDVFLELHHLPTAAQLQEVEKTYQTGALRCLVAITHGLADDLAAALPRNLIESKLIVAPDAVNPSRFRPQITAKRESKLTCGYIGGFSAGKGLELIVPLAKCMPGVEFHCHGGTEKQIGALRRDTDLSPNLKLHGRIRPYDVPEALRHIDVALLPNQPAVVLENGVDIGHYTSPMKLFEYMAAGKVIVASDLPVIREILTDGVNALLVPYDDPCAWKQAIERIAADPGLSARLSQQAAREARELYSYRARMSRILAAAFSQENHSPNCQKTSERAAA